MILKQLKNLSDERVSGGSVEAWVQNPSYRYYQAFCGERSFLVTTSL
jgi:hypothetical protein